MTYLDYLPHTPYAELPASAKTEISAAECLLHLPAKPQECMQDGGWWQ